MNEDAQLMRWLGAHRDVVTGGSSTDHLDVDTLSRHATGQLSAGKARLVSEHLLVCEDGRCGAFVRANAEDVDAAADLLYPSGEARGMHARTFLCREALWQAFEEIAREQGAPIDNVVSEAMRSYARQRSYGGRGVEAQDDAVEAARAQPEPQAHQGGYEAAPSRETYEYDSSNDPDLARTGMIRQPTQRVSTMEQTQTRVPAPAPRGGGYAPPPGGPNPRPSVSPTARGVAPPPGMARDDRMAGGRPMQRPFTAPLGQMQPPPAPPPPARRGPPPMSAGMPPPPSRHAAPSARSMPPPLPPSEPMVPAASPYGARGQVATSLMLTYQGHSVEVTKERFLLGRSKSQADLVLDDPNVSRQHAAIERVGDQWVLADLGSTNGCYIDGQRVSRRPITDGDVIEITTHQVICTLR